MKQMPSKKRSLLNGRFLKTVSVIVAVLLQTLSFTIITLALLLSSSILTIKRNNRIFRAILLLILPCSTCTMNLRWCNKFSRHSIIRSREVKAKETPTNSSIEFGFENRSSKIHFVRNTMESFISRWTYNLNAVFVQRYSLTSLFSSRFFISIACSHFALHSWRRIIAEKRTQPTKNCIKTWRKKPKKPNGLLCECTGNPENRCYKIMLCAFVRML